MKSIENLNSRFRVHTYESPASLEEIDDLLEFSNIQVPNDYLNIVKVMTEVEISIDNDSYVRIWSPDGCIEMNKEYEIQNYIPESLAIGDDEGGAALVMMNGLNGFGLYKLDFGNIDISDAEYISKSLEEFLVSGVGCDALKL